MDNIIQINVTDRRAQALAAPVIICGNSGYQVQFVFDDEWATVDPKTARFVYVSDGQVGHQDILFEGDTAEVPVLSNIREVRVGVFAGDLVTTTPAVIPCEPSILCGSGEPEAPSEDVYNQIMDLFNVMILAPNTVIDFVSDLRNLYDGVTWSDYGYGLSYNATSKGELVEATANSRVSDFIVVSPGMTYTANLLSIGCFYDADQNFVSATWSKTFTVPAGACFVRVATGFRVPSASYKELYLIRGTHASRPDDIGIIDVDHLQVKNEHIKSRSVTGDKLGFNTVTADNLACAKSNTNYLQGVTYTDGLTLNAYGEEQEAEGWSTSDFVNVKSNTEYTITQHTYASIMAYTDEKVPIGRITHSAGVFTTTAECCFVRIIQQTKKTEQTQLFESTADQTQPGTFTMEGLKVGMDNLGGDVLGAVKAPTSSILADLIFTTEAKNIVLIGDSITHGMGSSDFAQSTDPDDFLFNAGSFPQYRNYGVKCWGGMLKTYLEDKFNCSVTNNGASGATSQQLVDNWDAIVSADDDIILCMIGTNDRGLALSTIYQNIVAIYERAQANGQRVIFMAAPPTSVENEAQFTVCHMEDIDNLYNYVNNALNVGYISIYKEFLNYCRDTGTEVDTLLADGIHPNDTGYRLMFEIVLEALGFGRKRDGATW